MRHIVSSKSGIPSLDGAKKPKSDDTMRRIVSSNQGKSRLRSHENPKVMILSDAKYHQNPRFRVSAVLKGLEVMIPCDTKYHQNPGFWTRAATKAQK